MEYQSNSINSIKQNNHQVQVRTCIIHSSQPNKKNGIRTKNKQTVKSFVMIWQLNNWLVWFMVVYHYPKTHFTSHANNAFGSLTDFLATSPRTLCLLVTFILFQAFKLKLTTVYVKNLQDLVGLDQRRCQNICNSKLLQNANLSILASNLIFT